MTSRTAIFGAVSEPETRQEKLVELFRNRAELKKEFAELRKEKYRLEKRIREQHGATARIVQKLEHLELVSRKVFRGRLKGERRSRRKGQSVEFADFRNYVPGDDVRFIDWNLYARLDRLFLKLFLEEEDLHFYALIDVSTSMEFGTPSKMHFAKQLAASLSFIGLCRADRVKVEPLGASRSNPGPVLRGRRNLWRMHSLNS